MLLKNHEIRYILKRANGSGEHPQVETDRNTYLFKNHGGYIEILINGASIFSEDRIRKMRTSYKGIPPTVMDSEDFDGWKMVFWHCELPVNT